MPKEPVDVTALLAELQCCDCKLRSRAAQSLGAAREPAAVEPLIERLRSDSSMTVRSKSAAALARLRDERAIAALIAGMKAGNWSLQRQCVSALKKFGQSAIPEAIACLQDTCASSSVRCLMVERLGELGGEEAVAALVAATRDSDVSVAPCAALALAKTGRSEAALNALLAMFKHPEPLTRLAAVQALGELREERALAAIIALFQEREPYGRHFELYAGATNVLRSWAGVTGKAYHELAPELHEDEALKRIAAALSLVWLSDQRALEALQLATHDVDPLVGQAARWAHQSLETVLTYTTRPSHLALQFLLR